MELDASLLGEIFRSENRRLIGATTLHTRDAELSLDIVGEAFAVAFERRAAFRGRSREEAVAWVYAIARNTLTDYYRRGTVERRALERLGIDRSVMGDAERELVERLADQSSSSLIQDFERLPTDQREAVQMRVVDEVSYEVIAHRIGSSPQVVRARVSRGLRALRRNAHQRKEADAHFK